MPTLPACGTKNTLISMTMFCPELVSYLLSVVVQSLGEANYKQRSTLYYRECIHCFINCYSRTITYSTYFGRYWYIKFYFTYTAYIFLAYHPLFFATFKSYEDNTACIMLATTETHFKPRTKHISLKYHHFHDQIQQGHLQIIKVDTHSNIAYIFMKPLNKLKFQNLRRLLMGW
jgi:hypothetical protein